jgi:hypothetical protein
LDLVLKEAIEACPKIEEFWLALVKRETVIHKNIEKTRELLKSSLEKNPGNEKLILYAFRFEKTHGDY